MAAIRVMVVMVTLLMVATLVMAVMVIPVDGVAPAGDGNNHIALQQALFSEGFLLTHIT